VEKLREYMTVKEAAAYLGVCANTLRNWGAAGEIKERRHPMNGYRLYKRSELDRLIEMVDQVPAKPRRKPR